MNIAIEFITNRIKTRNLPVNGLFCDGLPYQSRVNRWPDKKNYRPMNRWFCDRILIGQMSTSKEKNYCPVKRWFCGRILCLSIIVNTYVTREISSQWKHDFTEISYQVSKPDKKNHQPVDGWFFSRILYRSGVNAWEEKLAANGPMILRDNSLYIGWQNLIWKITGHWIDDLPWEFLIDRVAGYYYSTFNRPKY